MNFFIICIIVRFLLVIIAKYINKDILQILGWISILPAIGFIFLYLTNRRKTGIEVGGKKIWWNKLRPIHGVLYLLFSIYAIKKETFAWMPLLLDVILGILFYIDNYHLH
tara:strand:+ start:92 stop:421 length:330 start_codon:yes stop_codon:yes gene_type:complete